MAACAVHMMLAAGDAIRWWGACVLHALSTPNMSSSDVASHEHDEEGDGLDATEAAAGIAHQILNLSGATYIAALPDIRAAFERRAAAAPLPPSPPPSPPLRRRRCLPPYERLHWRPADQGLAVSPDPAGTASRSSA